MRRYGLPIFAAAAVASMGVSSMAFEPAFDPWGHGNPDRYRTGGKRKQRRHGRKLKSNMRHVSKRVRRKHRRAM